MKFEKHTFGYMHIHSRRTSYTYIVHIAVLLIAAVFN